MEKEEKEVGNQLESKITEELVKHEENKPERDEKGRLLPGHTANPNGRPVGTLSITSAIKKKLQECPEGKEKTYLEFLVNKIMQQAVLEGDQQMIKQIWNYIDGMPKQKLGLGLDEDNGVSKLTIEVIKNKDEVNGGDKIANDNSI